MQSPSLKHILSLLSERVKVDFNWYKANTLRRRLQRRMEALKINEIEFYSSYLEREPEEAQRLLSTLLIGVTEFFRNPEAYETLRSSLQLLLAHKRPGDSFRIWSVGCATGEEPYSLAILLHELIPPDSGIEVRIFATDISPEALNEARKAIYSTEKLSGVSPERLARFFVRVTPDQYQVKDDIRKTVIFSRHNVISDPPFMRLDMVCCRNLLIYFRPELQAQLIYAFHYSLMPEGVFMTGKSESLDRYAPYYAPLEPQRSVYRKIERPGTSPFRNVHFERTSPELTPVPQTGNTWKEAIHQTLARTFEHPYVLINQQHEIIEAEGSLRLYLEPGAITAQNNLLRMVNAELRPDLQNVLRKVEGGAVSARSHLIRFDMFGETRFVRMTVKPLAYPQLRQGYYLVIFESVDHQEHPSLFQMVQWKDLAPEQVKELVEELRTSQEFLETYRGELDQSYFELQMLADELQSANEELKSANEELETTNEELRSLNEDLYVANENLRTTNDSLRRSEMELLETRMKLEASEKHLQLAHEVAGIASWELNLQTGVTTNTEGVYRLFGYEEEDVAGVAFGVDELTQRLHPEEKDRVSAVIAHSIAYREPYRIEYRITRKNDGEMRWIRDISFLVYDTSGQATRMLGINMDITEEYEMRIGLQESNRRYREYLDLVPYSIMIHSEGMHVFVNQQAMKVLGATSDDQLIGRPLWETLPPEQVPVVKARVQALYSKEQSSLFVEENLLRLDGTTVEVEIAATAMEYGGRPAALVIFREIEDKRRSEREAGEAHYRLRRAQEIGHIGVWEWHFPDNRLWLSENLLEIYGLEQGEESVTPDLIVKIIHPDDRLRVQGYADGLIQRDEPYRFDMRIIRSDGHMRYLHVQGELFRDKNGAPLRLLAISQDVTERKYAEEQVRQLNASLEQRVIERTEQLAISNRELESFAYSVSHDLRVPLRHLISYTRLLERRIGPLLDSNTQEFVDYITEAARKMNVMVEQLLVFSRIGRQEMSLTRMDTQTLVQRALDQVIPAPDAGEPLVQTLVHPLPGIYGDSSLTSQALMHVLSNAVKYGSVKEAPLIEIWGETHPNGVTLVVRDNGIGFDMAFKERIFGVFQRLHTESEFEGTGIGLAIVQRIMARHQGRVWAESVPGEGATFFLFFPEPE